MTNTTLTQNEIDLKSLRFINKLDIVPSCSEGQTPAEYSEMIGRRFVDCVGYFGANNVLHKLKVHTILVNGERVIDYIYSTCGTTFKYGQKKIVHEANQSHINCERCLKKMKKGA
jgi:hypothetical protein